MYTSSPCFSYNNEAHVCHNKSQNLRNISNFLKLQSSFVKYAFRDRRQTKRNFRRLWIVRINAAARLNGLSYSRLMNGLKVAGIDINRKMLSEIAIHDAAGFTSICEQAKAALAK